MATYNAEEVYRIGIEIEKNGRQFYQAAAEATSDPDIAALMRELAAWEDRHVALFTELAAGLPDGAGSGDALDPDGDVQRYLKAAADSHVFLQKGLDVAELARGCTGPEDVLKLALRFEKDSVVLYSTMQQLVPKDLGQETISSLALEEMQHVSIIQEKLAVLGGDG
jgi:rubrerythrin